MRIKTILIGEAQLPIKMVRSDAGYDLYTSEDTYIVGNSVKGKRTVVSTGLRIALPDPCSRWWWKILGLFCYSYHYYATVKSRSGFSSKGMEGCAEIPAYDNGMLLNEQQRYDCDVVTGTVDAGYRGTIGVIVVNRDKGFWLPKGKRIAQLIIEKAYDARFIEAASLDETERDGGFGHTGSR